MSNYNRLPKETLEGEGWVEPKEVNPKLEKGQMLGSVKYEVVDGKGIKTYEVLDPPPVIEQIVQPDPYKLLEQRIAKIEEGMLQEAVTK